MQMKIGQQPCKGGREGKSKHGGDLCTLELRPLILHMYVTGLATNVCSNLQCSHEEVP